MPRITQQDLADRLGISRTTVSKALKGDPAIAATTRAKVRAMAETLQFEPDPMLGALAAYRHRKQPETFHASIAWLHRESGAVDMNTFAGYADYRNGAEERARELGYRLDPIDLNRHPASTLPRLLRARGIRAVIFAPQPDPFTRLDLSLKDLCGVAIGYSLQSPALDVITNDHFTTMTHLVGKLDVRGFKRIGCYLWETDNERMGRRASSAFLATSREQGLSVHLYQKYDAGHFHRWVKKHRVEAVIARGPAELADLKAAGLCVPEDLAYAGYALESNETQVSGMHHHNHRIGREALDQAARKVQTGNTGLPVLPMRTLIPGEWVEGRTT